MHTRSIAIGLSALVMVSVLAITTYESPESKVAPSTVKQGFFIDSPVTGLYYKTSSNLSGHTDKGAFQYRPGDVISFFLGNDDDDYLLTTMSGQEVITPTMATTKPSRSINITRLLLSLDSTPQNRQEIILANKVLSDPNFQAQLKRLDLNLLDEAAKQLNLDWVSVEEAVQHLNESQHYIEKNFASNEVIFDPQDVRFKHVIIQKKDGRGRVCAMDLRYQHHPQYRPPIGELSYTITKESLIEHPSIGDYFNGCQLSPEHKVTKDIVGPLEDFSDMVSLVRCAKTGCTRHHLNGFSLDNYRDGSDWKYRSVAHNFDPTTQILMEKLQGLGKNQHVRHNNRSETLLFTYPDSANSQINYQGVWQQTQYLQDSMKQTCLLMRHKQVLRLPVNAGTCPGDTSLYTQDITAEYSDMWWINNDKPTAELAQMNVMVRWSPTPAEINHTTWEYLPVGRNWQQGILYRYQQDISHTRNGSEQIKTHTISEFVKVSEDV